MVTAVRHGMSQREVARRWDVTVHTVLGGARRDHRLPRVDLDVRIGARAPGLPWRQTLSDAGGGEALALMHERGLLSFSVNLGDFAKKYGIKRADPVSVRRVP